MLNDVGMAVPKIRETGLNMTGDDGMRNSSPHLLLVWSYAWITVVCYHPYLAAYIQLLFLLFLALAFLDKYAINEEMASDYTEVLLSPCLSHARGIL